jgi:hypothetical protein
MVLVFEHNNPENPVNPVKDSLIEEVRNAEKGTCDPHIGQGR